MILVTDMLYPVICVPGKVNGGFHEILRLEELINLWDISLIGPVRIYYISIRDYIDNASSVTHNFNDYIMHMYVCMHGCTYK